MAKPMLTSAETTVGLFALPCATSCRSSRRRAALPVRVPRPPQPPRAFPLHAHQVVRGFSGASVEEFLRQLKAVDDLTNGWFCEQLTTALSALNSPDDLFNFFDKLRGVLTAPEGASVEDVILDPNSQLGVFLRCCILAFNSMTFEGVCHLLADIVMYSNSTDASYDLAEDENFNNEMGSMMDANIGSQADMFDKYHRGFASWSHTGECSLALTRAPMLANILKADDYPTCLRSRWQLEAYLNQQADILEKDPSSVPLNSFNATMTKLRTLAPELHRVQFLQYLNALCHDDYVTSVDNLHRYFDYSAGMQGLFGRSVSPVQDIVVGKYESALLCLGNLHYYFGHPKKALEAFAEAVRVSQMNNDDSCLAFVVGAISNLLSKIGMSNTQQLLVPLLLKRSLKRADMLKLPSLISFDHLYLAKLDLKHVQRPLVSFGPNASTKLRTFPVDVCKTLRLSSSVLTDFGTDVLSTSNDNGSFSTSWLRNLSAATGSWRSSSVKSTKLHNNDFDNLHYHAQPCPAPAPVLQLAGSTYLLRATSWEHYGSAPMVRMNALVYATCFADASSSSEMSLAYVKLIQQLVVFKGYSAAFCALKLAEKKFPFSTSSHIQLLRMQILHERALHRGHLKVTQQLCDEFGVLSSSVCGVDIELKTEASVRRARTLLAAKQFSQAAAVANSLFSTRYNYNLQVENASVLLLLAEIYKRALSLVYQSLPMILGHGGLELRARAHITLAKCHLSDPKFSVPEDPEAVLDPLNQATEDLQVLEYHEMAYNHLGELDERDEAAACFKEHITALENPHNEEDSLAY
ncbi:hypothetical protein BS78_08G045400 [Paspalum vaginatum]|nr:hypothetical protein BS78_08G045400 [Paspalum vaginatum]